VNTASGHRRQTRHRLSELRPLIGGPLCFAPGVVVFLVGLLSLAVIALNLHRR
jgi:hypothetical protein